MNTNPLLDLASFGQSLWIDYIRRDLIASGRLAAMIESDGVCGLTSNPAIFEKAIAGSSLYDGDIRRLMHEGHDVLSILEELTISDVQGAADVLRRVYDATEGRDGFVSLEINPHLAHDTEASIRDGQRLWERLARPNVLIKVPATSEGLPVIRQLIVEGINVNVTLLFDVGRYREVAEAYISGLEERRAAGKDVQGVASVASFFVSRIDSHVDRQLREIAAGSGGEAPLAQSLIGQLAIDNARSAYLAYQTAFSDRRFERLRAQGARPQRVLWASTSTKDPTFSDVKYVEALIGADTVNTMPVETIDAYRDHGRPASRLLDDRSRIGWALRRLAELDIDMAHIARQLEEEGVQKFIQPFDSLLEAMTRKVSVEAVSSRR